MKEKCQSSCSASANPRLNKVGGQAVLEGVMMKAGERTVTTCRKEDGSLFVSDGTFVSVRKKHKFLNIPLLRGVVNFFEMMKLSIKTLGVSADALGLEEEESTGKFSNWLKNKLGIRLTDLIMIISVILGLALSVFLFLFLPIWVTAGINYILELCDIPHMGPILTAIVEGLIKVSIFVIYLVSVSFMSDIKRTFMYHGAEHKSIACFESGDELTPENAMRHKRFHPRCGTSFMFFMILIGIFAGIIIKTLIPGLPTWLYTVIRLGILPLVMGLGYEIIMLAGKHNNIVTRILSAPGLWMQKITTKEPTEDMLEVAITSIKCALRDEFPEFMQFFEEKPWEKKAEGEAEADASAEDSESPKPAVDENAASPEAGAVEITASATDEVNSAQPSEPVIADTAEPSEESVADTAEPSKESKADAAEPSEESEADTAKPLTARVETADVPSDEAKANDA